MSVPSVKSKEIKSLGQALTKEYQQETPSAETCLDILKSLERQSSTSNATNETTDQSSSSISSSSVGSVGGCSIDMTILKETLIGKCLTKSNKAFRKHKRSAEQSEEEGLWKQCIDISEDLLKRYKKVAALASSSSSSTNSSAVKDTEQEDTQGGDGDAPNTLPTSTSIYRMRLKQQKKDMYKDPPILPPPSIQIHHHMRDPTDPLIPKRSKKTMELSFTLPPSMSQDKNKSHQQLVTLLKDFKPNRTPEEILRAGSFGGTYFRPITSAVTNVTYKPSQVLKDTVHSSWIINLDAKTMLTSSTYRPSINKYKKKCGGSLGMWESSGWITNTDPYGWFQWYCRFYQGRRSSDDVRQIQRWCKSAGSKGRFKSQLCNKILKAGGVRSINDVGISPVIRQTLLHWGLEITEHVLMVHAKRVGK